MNFTDGTTNVSLYIDENKIFIDGILNYITEIKVNTSQFARFKFGVYEAKMNNDRLTYINTLDNTVKSLQKAKENSIPIEQQNFWDTYVVSSNLEICISSDKKHLKIKNKIFQVTNFKIQGIYDIYVCERGELSISKNENIRQSMWNNLPANLKK